MNGKLATTIRCYSKITNVIDSRPTYNNCKTAYKPALVIKQKLKKLQGLKRIKFIENMKSIVLKAKKDGWKNE